MNIKYVEGDLFSIVDGMDCPVIIPHCCNDIGVFGAGFVIPLSKRFPEARRAFLEWNELGAIRAEQVEGIRNICYDGYSDTEVAFPHELRPTLGKTQFVQVQSSPFRVVANMIGQHGVGGKRPLRYESLAKCMEAVGRHARIVQKCGTNSWGMNGTSDQCEVEIVCPLFGSGLAGGDWNFIEKLIEDCWDDIPVTVCYLPGQSPFVEPIKTPIANDESPTYDNLVIDATYEVVISGKVYAARCERKVLNGVVFKNLTTNRPSIVSQESIKVRVLRRIVNLPEWRLHNGE